MGYKTHLGKYTVTFPVSSPVNSLAACAIGAIILVGLLIGYTQHRAFNQVAQTTLGTVIDITSGRNKYARIQYETADSQRYTFTTSARSLGGPSYRVGQQVAVLYDPAAPQNAQLAEAVTPILALINIFMFVVGVLLVCSGVYSLVYYLVPPAQRDRSKAFDLKNKRDG